MRVNPYLHLPQKKLHDLTIFWYSRFPKRKKLHTLTIFLYLHLLQKKLSDFTAKKKKLHDFIEQKSYMHVANLILSTALKRWGPPRRQGSCSHQAHLWATADFFPRSEAMGIPRRQGVCSHQDHLWATADFVPRSEALGPSRRQVVCNHQAQLWATQSTWCFVDSASHC